ncbi:putative transcription factor [Rosellinia necatrix]|uniref:Putative transcription factor n=1 Tax=Rosellinia necatrix TaxID=77044 RepID=A0A1S7UMH0_ROSNE|nr:putative transcription factor [Rosellinia necatrix]
MHLSGPVVPSQRYSSASDYAYENHHEAVRMTRQPLSESTGNVQAHSLAVATGTSALCYNQLSLSPPIHSIPTPPILPTQALTSTYGTSLRGERSLHRNVSLQELSMGSSRIRKNPIYHHKNFADYRNKVMQKELDKEQPVWPDWLEDAFLDALLLIPQLGRKKFSSKTILYGRNMLITEYLWIYHWTLHPPKKGERVPSGKQREKTKQNAGHPMFRSRKQVSSHIQVLKGFFPTLSTFHFIFPRQKDGLEDDKKSTKEEEDTESFKNNQVLISIANGRLPDERPNYEYFSRLLNAENDVFIRPKQCWIFVSSSKIALKEKQVSSKDGTANKQVTGTHADGLSLTEADYPHLKLNESKDYKDLPRQGNQPTVLLHEYTRTLAQKESSSVKEISSRWDVRFPELREKLTAALDDVQPSDERTSRCVVGPCDTFHFETVLDLHSTSKFPSGSDLNGLVEFTISKPDLHNHTWRSRTCVIKPDELYMSDIENEYWEESSSIDVIPSHRVGCAGLNRCDCAARGSRDTISIPFPANSWANTFIKLAPFVTAEREKKDRERATRAAASLSGRAEREAARMKKENEEATSHLKAKGPTPKDLLNQVAMYQEIWSAPQSETASRSTDEDSSSKRSRGKWTRRAVILWTFVPVHENTDEKGKTTVVPPGTNWRFLTKIDPTSSYHQQQAYVSGSSTTLSRDNIMSPNPGYAHHVNAAMHENFGNFYNADPTNPFTLPSQSHGHHSRPQFPHSLQTSHLAGLNDVLDGLSNGLATPPPSATFPTGYPHSFDAGGGGGGGGGTNIDAGHTLHHQLSFMSDGTSATDHSQATSLLAGIDAHAGEPFLAGLDVVPGYMPDFQTASTLGDLTTRYMGGGGGGGGDHHHATTADVSGVGWADARGLPPTGTAMEPPWAALAAAHPGGGHAAGGELHDAWATWAGGDLAHVSVAASDYSRRTSASLFDSGLSSSEGEALPPPTTFGGTGLTPPPPPPPPHSSSTHGIQHQPSPTPRSRRRHHIPSLTSHIPLPPLSQTAGRKRSRTESVALDGDDDEEGSRCEGYPAHSLRKLAHHPASATDTATAAYAPRRGDNGDDDDDNDDNDADGGAPLAVMDGDVSADFFG